jgi:hypothetical protein
MVMSFVPIQFEDYVCLHLAANPGTNSLRQTSRVIIVNAAKSA